VQFDVLPLDNIFILAKFQQSRFNYKKGCTNYLEIMKRRLGFTQITRGEGQIKVER
jgi:hypothetical protein